MKSSTVGNVACQKTRRRQSGHVLRANKSLHIARISVIQMAGTAFLDLLPQFPPNLSVSLLATFSKRASSFLSSSSQPSPLLPTLALPFLRPSHVLPTPRSYPPFPAGMAPTPQFPPARRPPAGSP